MYISFRRELKKIRNPIGQLIDYSYTSSVQYSHADGRGDNKRQVY